MHHKQRKTLWRLWCYSLGAKSGKNDYEANIVSIIRTFIFLTYLTTNCFIVINAIHNLTTPKCFPQYEKVSDTRKN